MLKHADIWAAIDRLAQENGLTASGLARRGDRVLVRTTAGGIFVRRLLRQTARRIELQPLGTGEEISLPAEEVASVARIVWASQ
jgi:phage repressor protein C with HTH and peptisase S24 domain